MESGPQRRPSGTKGGYSLRQLRLSEELKELRLKKSGLLRRGLSSDIAQLDAAIDSKKADLMKLSIYVQRQKAINSC